MLLTFEGFINEQAQSATYQVGSKGDAVKAIQTKLISLGLLKLDKPTGTFGEKTKAAVVEFQKKNGLDPDGVIGAKTYPKLMSDTSTSTQAASTKYFDPNKPIALDTVAPKPSTVDSFSQYAKKEPVKFTPKKEAAVTTSMFQVIPPNLKQMIHPKELTNADFTKDQLVALWNAIQNARKRPKYVGKTKGDTEYIDFGPDYDKWFVQNKAEELDWKKLIQLSTTDPKFAMATTVGRGNWEVDPNDPNPADPTTIIYTDRYNWNKTKEGEARYVAAKDIKDSELQGMNDFEKWYYLKTHSKPELSAYQAFRELQHRNAPVGEAAGPEIKLILNKNELFPGVTT